MEQTLNELSKSIRFDNASKGFDPTEGGVNRYILLTISELCEAQNELRDGRIPTEVYYSKIGRIFKDEKEALYHSIDGTIVGYKPEGFSVEVADAIIRLLDIAGKFEHKISYTTKGVDFENNTIDDWLLGIVNIISDMFNYNPTNNDFWFALEQATATLFLLCEKHRIDIMKVIEIKLAYNRTRPPKHGRHF